MLIEELKVSNQILIVKGRDMNNGLLKDQKVFISVIFFYNLT